MMTIRRVLLVLSVGAVAFAVGAALPEFRAALQAISEANRLWLALALVFEVAAVASLPQVYRAALQVVGGRLRYARALQISMGAFTLSRVLPGGGAAGGVFAAHRLTQFGQRPAVGAAAVALFGVGSMTTLGLIVATGAGWSALRGHLQGPYLGLVAAVTALLAMLVISAARALRSRRFRAWLTRAAERLVGAARAAALRRALDELARRPLGLRDLAPLAGWSAVNWLAEIAVLWLSFAALGHQVPVGVLILGFGVANLLTALPHTPGGIGVVEAGMAATYVGLGVPAPIAISAVLAYRLAAYWLPVLAGIPQYLRRGVA